MGGGLGGCGGGEGGVGKRVIEMVEVRVCGKGEEEWG